MRAGVEGRGLEPKKEHPAPEMRMAASGSLSCTLGWGRKKRCCGA